MDYGISPDTFVGESLETAFGLKAYSTIMQFTKNRPFVATPEFRKTFNGYYKLRQRSAKWYDKYYSLFESQFCADCSFEDLLREMHTVNGSLEVSFISKLEMSRNVQSGNTQNLKSPFVNQAACCACAHSRYLAGGSPSGLRV